MSYSERLAAVQALALAVFVFLAWFKTRSSRHSVVQFSETTCHREVSVLADHRPRADLRRQQPEREPLSSVAIGAVCLFASSR